MKAITRVRIDEFISTDQTCRIIGRKDHIISTEQYIEREYRPVVMVLEEEDNEDWYLEGFWDKITTERRGHLPILYDGYGEVNTHRFGFLPFALNRSIEKCLFKPLTSQNHVDTDPATQVKLLPYLCEANIVQNLSSRSTGTGDILAYDTTILGGEHHYVDEVQPYSYKPTEDSMFFVTFETAADTATIISNCFEQTQSLIRGTRFRRRILGNVMVDDPDDVVGFTLNFTHTHADILDYAGDIIAIKDSYTLDTHLYFFCIDSVSLGFPEGSVNFVFSLDAEITLTGFNEHGYAETEGMAENDEGLEVDGFHHIVLWQSIDDNGVGEANGPETGPLNGTVDQYVDVEVITLHLPQRRYARGHFQAPRMCPVLRQALYAPGTTNLDVLAS